MSFKAMIMLSRRDDMTHDDFVRWWTGDHAPMAAALPGVRRITFNICEDHDDVDGITELWFDSREAFESAYATDHGKAVAADSMAHVRRRTRLFVDERPIVA